MASRLFIFKSKALKPEVLNLYCMNASTKWRLGAAVVSCAVALGGTILLKQVQHAPIENHIRAGEQLLQEGHSTAAESEWEQAVRLDPRNARAWELLGNLHLSAGSFKMALEDFGKVLELEPQTPNLKGRMALAAFQTKDEAAALRLAKAQLQDDPDNINALQVAVNVEKHRGQSDAMVAQLQHMVALQPQNTAFIITLTDELFARGQFDKVIPLADRLVQLQPHSSLAFFRRGLSIYSADPDTNALKRSQADFERASQLDPTDPEAHRYLGRIAMRLNQPKEAIKQFEAVGRGRPYASAHLMELSEAYRKVGNTHMADVLSARYNLIKQTNTQWLDMAAHLQKVPDKSALSLQLGQLMLKNVEADGSIYELYRFQMVKGKIQSIQAYLTQAKRLKPRDPAATAALAALNAACTHHLEAGLRAATAQQPALMRAEFEHAVALCPEDKRATSAVARVE